VRVESGGEFDFHFFAPVLYGYGVGSRVHGTSGIATEFLTTHGDQPAFDPLRLRAPSAMITAHSVAHITFWLFKPFNVGQICPLQNSPAQIGIAQIGIAQISASEVSPAQISASEISASEVSMRQVSFNQDSPAWVGVSG
jgi:hypothetical protein